MSLLPGFTEEEVSRLPRLFIGFPTKMTIHGSTVQSLMTSMRLIKGYLPEIRFLIGKSNIDQARSIILTDWYDNYKENDLFLFIDSDQTFSTNDIEALIDLNSDVACGVYSNLRGLPTCHPKDPESFFKGESTELYYGATGFMMIRKSICHRIYDYLKKRYGGEARFNIGPECQRIIPFFTQQFIDGEIVKGTRDWLGEDYGFCWLARQVGGTIRGLISPSIGHEVFGMKYFFPANYKSAQWGSDTIVYYTGNSMVKWSPKDIRGGLGGSETAVIYLARLWQKMGYKVFVFGNVIAGTYDEVVYKSADDFKVNDKYHNLILWRGFALHVLPQVNAKNLIIDMHDVPTEGYNIIVPHENKITKIMVKSEFHKRLFNPKIHHKIEIVQNGINFGFIKRFGNEKRNITKLLYASNYNRGLEQILKWGFPMIRAEIPDAELHIYYGMDLKRDGDPDFMNRITELMKQPGVFDHGKVGQDDLAKVREEVAIHYYPTFYPEIDCITVKESAYAGCIPIVSNCAVFADTDRKYILKVNGNPTTEEMHRETAKLIINLIKNPTLMETARKKVAENIDAIESWEQIAEKWANLFFADSKNIKEIVVKQNTASNTASNTATISKPARLPKNINKVYVINLKRRPDRLAEFYERYPYHADTVERFDAVDGKLLQLTPEIAKIFQKNDFRNRKAIIGCALSHYGVWKRIVETRSTNVLVFEDDVFFEKDFINRWESGGYCDFPADYDILYIGGSEDFNEFLGKIPMVNKCYGKKKLGNLQFYSYVLSYDGARKLCDYVESIGITKAVDHYVSWVCENVIKYSATPFITTSPVLYKTDIQLDSDSFPPFSNNTASSNNVNKSAAIIKQPDATNSAALNGISKIFVINLKRRPDRLKEFYDRLPFPKNIVESVEGFDGLNEALTDEMVAIFDGNNFANRRGVIGCAISHYRIWKKIVKEQIKGNILIFEDDAFFCNDFVETWNKYYEHLPTGSEMAYLGGRPDPLEEFKLGRERVSRYWSKRSRDYYYCLYSYITNIAGCQKFCDYIERNGLWNAVDNLAEFYTNDSIYSANPMICYSPIAYKTDVQTNDTFDFPKLPNAISKIAKICAYHPDSNRLSGFKYDFECNVDKYVLNDINVIIDNLLYEDFEYVLIHHIDDNPVKNFKNILNCFKNFFDADIIVFDKINVDIFSKSNISDRTVMKKDAIKDRSFIICKTAVDKWIENRDLLVASANRKLFV